jgi:UDP-glucuronate 4-epimerase
LLDAGHRVASIDSINDAHDVRLKQWRLAQLTGRDSFTFEQVDITDRAALAATFSADGSANSSAPNYDAVFHLTARAGVRLSVDNPWIYIDANATGTLKLFDLYREHGVGRFVFLSTSSLYGANNLVPYREDADTNRPLSPYAASKKAAEAMCSSYHHLHKIDVTVPQYFTVYGPAGRPDMKVFDFVRNIAEGEPIRIAVPSGVASVPNARIAASGSWRNLVERTAAHCAFLSGPMGILNTPTGGPRDPQSPTSKPSRWGGSLKSSA